MKTKYIRDIVYIEKAFRSTVRVEAVHQSAKIINASL